MKELIDIYRMKEVSPETRIKLIKQMGELINQKYAANITEPLVEELVGLLTREMNRLPYVLVEREVTGWRKWLS